MKVKETIINALKEIGVICYENIQFDRFKVDIVATKGGQIFVYILNVPDLQNRSEEDMEAYRCSALANYNRGALLYDESTLKILVPTNDPQIKTINKIEEFIKYLESNSYQLKSERKVFVPEQYLNFFINLCNDISNNDFFENDPENKFLLARSLDYLQALPKVYAHEGLNINLKASTFYNDSLGRKCSYSFNFRTIIGQLSHAALFKEVDGELINTIKDRDFASYIVYNAGDGTSRADDLKFKFTEAVDFEKDFSKMESLFKEIFSPLILNNDKERLKIEFKIIN